MVPRQYLAIDLKLFYASTECREQNLDPLTTNLVVADVSRTEKTICLAVSPSLKSYGISGRARLFEVVQKVDRVNRERKARLVKSGINDFSRYRMSQGKHGAIKRLNEWIDRSTGYWHEVDDVLRSTTAKQLKCV